MKKLILLALMTTTASASDSNEMMAACLASHGYSQETFEDTDWSSVAACHSDYRVGQNSKELAEMRDFLKHNPRYRHPGQSLNSCWGKPREMPFESVNASASPDGSWYVGINYKDTIPAGCFENGPWDNRDKK